MTGELFINPWIISARPARVTTLAWLTGSILSHFLHNQDPTTIFPRNECIVVRDASISPVTWESQSGGGINSTGLADKSIAYQM